MKATLRSGFSLLVLIISSVISNHSFAESPQLAFGDKLSIFSDKAYRKNNGTYFEAVGNVVIISQKDTVYGEVASLDQATMQVKIEGNVRLITKDLTLYGSRLDYNITTGAAVIKNARILTTDYNLVATSLMRINETEYLAEDAEFTTCKDCAESWSIFGKKIRVRVGKYVQIQHGLAKIKGVNVLYIPYIVLPIATTRKTGLLFPGVSTRIGEGLALSQPVFVALGDSKDTTISPTFWAQRGYGGDIQYRQRFKDLSWLEINSRTLNDTIYLPGKNGLSKSGDEFFRYFVEAESHQQFTPNLGSHVRYSGTRDLDIVRDHPTFTDPRTLSSDYGLTGHVDWRQDLFSASTEVNYLRNQLFADPLEFDRSYVQVLPRVSLSSVPISLLQTKTPGFQHITMGIDGSFTRFRQVDEESPGGFLRNADRVSVFPYAQWNFISWGPVNLKSRYVLDQQMYQFADHRQPMFGKNAGLMQTEISFSMDRIYGLAYEEKIPLKYVSDDELVRLREKREQGLSPFTKPEKDNRLIGEMPDFESELAQENIIQVRKSFRHAQDFKFIHHFQTSHNEYGNERFLKQIRGDNLGSTSQAQQGWFDYEDAIREQEYLSGSATTRIAIPPQNTMEFQWNNNIVQKIPKSFSFLDDDKYLRDNFTYSQVAYFNVSQGYLLDEEYAGGDVENRLTRLAVQAGYAHTRWSVNASEYYFHSDRENIFNTSVTRRFDFMNVFSNYSYNSFPNSNQNTLALGGQLRPTDVLGFALVKDVDLEAKKNIRTIYSIDIMPDNNCWIFSLSKTESLVGSRYSFDFILNWGDDKFDRYRTDYFAMKRL